MVCYSQCRSGREHRVVIFPIPLVQRGLRMHHRPRLRLRGCCTATWYRLALPSRYHRRHAAVCGPACLHLLEGDAVFLPIVSGFGEDTATAPLSLWHWRLSPVCGPSAVCRSQPAAGRLHPGWDQRKHWGDAVPEKCLGRQLPHAVNSPEPPSAY